MEFGNKIADFLRQGTDTLVNLPSEAQRFITNPQAFTQLLTGKNPLPRETGFAAGATGLPFTEMSVLDSNQAPYMQGYTQGEPIGYAAMAAPLAIPAVKALAPKANQMAENYMFNQGMMPSIVPPSPAKVADALRQPEKNALGFYSPLDEAVLNLQNQKGTGQQYLAQLLKTQGVKQEEVATRGLDTFLTQNPKVTKTQIEDFLGQNPVQIKETVLGGSQPEPKFKQIEPDLWESNVGNIYKQGKDDYAFIVGGEGEMHYFNSFDEAQDFAKNFAKTDEGAVFADNTKFKDYTLPAGENYREVLIQYPNVKGKDFESSHFDQPNILAHMRVNDRTIDGKKTLFVEEIQSDWHQAGRKKGYETPKGTLPEGHTVSQEMNADNQPVWVVRDKKGESVGFGADKQESINSLRPTGVPDAPFKKNWQELAMKRAMQMAAEGGYDRVAFTTGKQQADRYNLRKHIEEIHYEKLPDGRYSVTGKDKNGNVPLDDIYTESQLENTIGKEITKKIINNEGEKIGRMPEGKNVYSISGEGLEVGGEGMKGFYDKILPDFINKYGKKNNLKVGKTKMRTSTDKQAAEDAKLLNDLGVSKGGPNAYEDVHYFDLTPEAKTSFLSKGQPMFAAAPIVATDEETRREMLEKLFNSQK